VVASYITCFPFESHKFGSMHGTMSYDVITVYRVADTSAASMFCFFISATLAIMGLILEKVICKTWIH